jgi:thiol-disulfide isomerase/thioredoxin
MKRLVLVLLLLSIPAQAAGLQPFGRGSWQQLRQQHAGRPLIVHFWGVTCGPCLAELPRWGEFIREKPGVDIALVAADPVMADQNPVAGALAKAGCGAAENWIFADPFTERLTYEVDPDWAGELPYTLLVGTDASVTAILGEVNFSELRVWVAEQRKSAMQARPLP